MSNDRTDYQDIDASYASGMAAFEAKNFSQAMRFLSPMAEQGDAEAQHRCAIMYQNGLGIVANEEKAAAMMRAAAEQGHAVAQHGLGFMYMEGECVQQDSMEAIKWFEKAAEQGLVDNYVYSLFADSRGHLWIGSRHAGVTRCMVTADGRL